jgi:histidinol-phosphatase (PHP family)
MLTDSHIHLQPHGQAPPMTVERIEEYVEAGRARGIERIAITEHLFRFEEAYRALDGWWDDDPRADLAAIAKQYWDDHVSGSVADYVRTVEEAKRRGLPVLLGIEMDWLDGRSDALREFLRPYDWDIVLGSVHYIGAWGFDCPDEFGDEWAKRDVAQAWADYGALARDLALSGLADVLTHPDVPKVLGHRPADETPLHALIIEGASATGMAIELNSNGLRKACAEIYPSLPLLEQARAHGLPITFASDAHVPARVGESFDQLAAWARRAGYSDAVTFINRKPERLSWESVVGTQS